MAAEAPRWGAAMHPTERSSLARALGRIPSGLYVLSTRDGDRPVGLLASLVMQVGLEPPTVCAAVGLQREFLPHARRAGTFALSILDPTNRALLRRFSTGGADPFAGLATSRTPGGLVVLDDALGWIECRLTGEHATSDHVVLFGEATAGAVAREGEPFVHLRKNGLSY